MSKKWRIYRREGSTRHDLIDYPPTARRPVEPRERDEPPLVEPTNASVTETARRVLLERYAPASVLIDQKGRVLYFHGATRDYLEQPPGEPTRDLLSMARNGLALKLRGAIREASKGTGSVTVDAHIRHGKTARTVAMTVMPLPASSRDSSFLLVSFAPGLPASEPVGAKVLREDVADTSASEQALQDELVSTRAEFARWRSP